MGQYHKLVNMTASQFLHPYRLGCGMKAWEQAAGGIPAALAALLAASPGNMPGDVAHHPMVGRWAGHRVLAIGDYAEKTDIPGFTPSLLHVYERCVQQPHPDDFSPCQVIGSDGSDVVVTAEEQYASAMKDRGPLGKMGQLFEDVSPFMVGLVEESLSVRFCGVGWRTVVPVVPSLSKGDDGKLHYVLSNLVKDDPAQVAYIWRSCGWGGWHGGPTPDVNRLPPGLQRWPWDRPAAGLSWHNCGTLMENDGQTRVFANLDRQEFFDPAAFGESPTTLGIMRACDPEFPKRMMIDLVVDNWAMQTNVRKGPNDLSSAGALFAMLLHPEHRGGGDISPRHFPEVGRWRNNRLVLTSERGGSTPSTDHVRGTFTDVTERVLHSAAVIADH